MEKPSSPVILLRKINPEKKTKKSGFLGKGSGGNCSFSMKEQFPPEILYYNFSLPPVLLPLAPPNCTPDRISEEKAKVLRSFS